MDYVESLRYLYGLADFERSGRFADRPDVEPVRALLHELGDPHLGRATVHIAGSKGKGSVAAMVEAIMRAAGYTTGLFTSPHLHRFPERIQTGIRAGEHAGKEHGLELRPVTSEEFVAGITEVAAAVERVRAAMPDRALVTFDVLTALGFLLFRKHDVEVQVIEVGLGGLLDSTNVFGGFGGVNLTPQPPLRPHGEGGPSLADASGGCDGSDGEGGPSPADASGNGGGEGETSEAMPRGSARGVPTPLVTVITNIGLEHREILGNTVPEIARQKAGIIVPGVPVIMAPQRESAAEVIREVAAAKGAPLTEVALVCNLRREQAGMDHQTFRLRTSKQGYTIKLPLLGKHQLDNAATAVLAVEALGNLTPHPPLRPHGEGGPSLADASGRTEVASSLPPVDGSHRGVGDASAVSPSPKSGRGPGGGVSPEAVQKGLEGVRWPGRIEILRRRPLLIVDGAHTADSARRLRDTLGEYMRIDQATLVVGVMGDKDLEGLVMAIEAVARRVVATQADHPRALAAEKVARVFRDRSIETYVESKLGAAIDMAQNLSTGSDAVVILGSIALAGEARAYVLGLERDPPV